MNADVVVGLPGTLLRIRAEIAETDLVVTVFVGELVDLGAELVEVTVEREVRLHDVLALGVSHIRRLHWDPINFC